MERRKLIVGLTLTLPLLKAQPPQLSDENSSLRGVKTFHVIVEEIKKNAPGLIPEYFQTDVELRCRQAGIKLEDTPGTYLYVSVTFQELFYANGRSEGVYAVQ